MERLGLAAAPRHAAGHRTSPRSSLVAGGGGARGDPGAPAHQQPVTTWPSSRVRRPGGPAERGRSARHGPAQHQRRRLWPRSSDPTATVLAASPNIAGRPADRRRSPRMPRAGWSHTLDGAGRRRDRAATGSGSARRPRPDGAVTRLRRHQPGVGRRGDAGPYAARCWSAYHSSCAAGPSAIWLRARARAAAASTGSGTRSTAIDEDRAGAPGGGERRRRRGRPAGRHDEPDARPGSRRPRPGSGPSSPTPPTTCRARWPRSAQSSRWPWPTRTRSTSATCARDLLGRRPRRWSGWSATCCTSPPTDDAAPRAAAGSPGPRGRGAGGGRPGPRRRAASLSTPRAVSAAPVLGDRGDAAAAGAQPARQRRSPTPTDAVEVRAVGGRRRRAARRPRRRAGRPPRTTGSGSSTASTAATRRASRHTGGSGLGLAIARTLAERNGGTLVLADPDGGPAGARFVLRLPTSGG